MTISFLAAIALIVAQSHASSAPEPQPCVTKEETANVGLVFMADGVAALAQQCVPHLPETAFLRKTAGAAYIGTLRSAADTRRASALEAYGRMARRHLPQGVTASTVMERIGPDIASLGAIGAFTTASCGEFNRLIEALSPLPPENIVTILSASAGLVAIVAAPAGIGPPAPASTTSRRSPPDIFCPA